MPSHNIETVLFELIKTGLNAVGCRIPVEHDGDAIYLRTLGVVVTDKGSIQCFDLAAPDTPIMEFPKDAFQSAASAVVIRVLSGIVTRAIEADGQ